MNAREPQLERWTLNGWSVEWLGKDWSGSVDLDSGSVGRLIRSVDLAPPAHSSHQPGVISRTDSKQTRSPWNERIKVWLLENTEILPMILWLGWVTPKKFSLMNVLESYCSEGCQVMFLFGERLIFGFSSEYSNRRLSIGCQMWKEFQIGISTVWANIAGLPNTNNCPGSFSTARGAYGE